MSANPLAGNEATDVPHAVEEFVGLVRDRPRAGDEELAQALMALGASRDTAERVVAFVPLAFGRQLLSPRRPRLAAEYEIRDPESGGRARAVITSEPAYRAALEYLQHHADDPAMIRVAARSAEVDAAFRLVPANGSLEKLVFTEPVMLRIPIPAAAPKRSWWKRWTGAG